MDKMKVSRIVKGCSNYCNGSLLRDSVKLKDKVNVQKQYLIKQKLELLQSPGISKLLVTLQQPLNGLFSRFNWVKMVPEK